MTVNDFGVLHNARCHSVERRSARGEIRSSLEPLLPRSRAPKLGELCTCVGSTGTPEGIGSVVVLVVNVVGTLGDGT